MSDQPALGTHDIYCLLVYLDGNMLFEFSSKPPVLSYHVGYTDHLERQETLKNIISRDMTSYSLVKFSGVSEELAAPIFVVEEDPSVYQAEITRLRRLLCLNYDRYLHFACLHHFLLYQTTPCHFPEYSPLHIHLHEAETFLRSRQLCSYSRISQHVTEPEGSLPCSQ
jgi:hypothetical protein